MKHILHNARNCVCARTSGERGSVLSVVLDLRVLPHQQAPELLHLPLQQVAHGQQGAHQLSTHLRRHRRTDDLINLIFGAAFLI